MNVKKEVYERCLSMIEKELVAAKYKLLQNKRAINNLAKEQRILKAEVGRLYELCKLFKD